LKIFFAEHLHADDEVRLVMDGSGFFDIRDENDKWVRLAVGKGDLITLPAGAYHRFTTDDKVGYNFNFFSMFLPEYNLRFQLFKLFQLKIIFTIYLA